MNLLGLELEVAGHAHDAEDHEGVPPKGIRRAPVYYVGELLQAQEGKGLVEGLVQEVPDGGRGPYLAMWIIPMDGVSLVDVSSQAPLVRQSAGRSSGAASWCVDMKASRAFP